MDRDNCKFYKICTRVKVYNCGLGIEVSKYMQGFLET